MPDQVQTINEIIAIAETMKSTDNGILSTGEIKDWNKQEFELTLKGKSVPPIQDSGKPMKVRKGDDRYTEMTEIEMMMEERD